MPRRKKDEKLPWYEDDKVDFYPYRIVLTNPNLDLEVLDKWLNGIHKPPKWWRIRESPDSEWYITFFSSTDEFKKAMQNYPYNKLQADVYSYSGHAPFVDDLIQKEIQLDNEHIGWNGVEMEKWIKSAQNRKEGIPNPREYKGSHNKEFASFARALKKKQDKKEKAGDLVFPEPSPPKKSEYIWAGDPKLMKIREEAFALTPPLGSIPLDTTDDGIDAGTLTEGDKGTKVYMYAIWTENTNKAFLATVDKWVSSIAYDDWWFRFYYEEEGRWYWYFHSLKDISEFMPSRPSVKEIKLFPYPNEDAMIQGAGEASRISPSYVKFSPYLAEMLQIPQEEKVEKISINRETLTPPIPPPLSMAKKVEPKAKPKSKPKEEKVEKISVNRETLTPPSIPPLSMAKKVEPKAKPKAKRFPKDGNIRTYGFTMDAPISAEDVDTWLNNVSSDFWIRFKNAKGEWKMLLKSSAPNFDKLLASMPDDWNGIEEDSMVNVLKYVRESKKSTEVNSKISEDKTKSEPEEEEEEEEPKPKPKPKAKPRAKTKAEPKSEPKLKDKLINVRDDLTKIIEEL